MTEDTANLLVGAVAIIIALLAVFVVPNALKKRRERRVTVYEHETGLLIRKGRIERELGPGVYSTWLNDDEIVRYDSRELMTPVAGQEILTRDLMPVRISLNLRYRIADARRHRTASANPYQRLYEAGQLGLRTRVQAVDLDELTANRDKATTGLLEELQAAAAGIGVEVIAVELLDLTLAGPAKQAYADLWKAQKDGLAALERARGEQASLRSLANAARMLKGNPELMNLRLLQALAGGPGRPAPTIVLGGAGIAPVTSLSGTALTGGESGAETRED